MKEKAVIFDASTLISFAMNGLLDEIRDLKNIFQGRFLLTKEVREEVIDRPIESKRFELEALFVKNLLDSGVLEMPSSFGVKDLEVSNATRGMLGIANNLFESNGRNIDIVAAGETSCLAFSEILSKKGVKNIIAVDERTLRLLSEKPENLKDLLQRKLKANIQIRSKNYSRFKGFKFVRSAELIFVSYKKGLIDLKGPRVLDALLWSMKFKGCAISDDEINEIKR